MNSESSIVIIDYNNEKRNKVEKKVSSKLKNEIGLRINTLILDIQKNVDLIVQSLIILLSDIPHFSENCFAVKYPIVH